ncbi:MAG: hypothetical protein MHM6MM_008115 [Cercozoa sp. M6MM]
MHEFRHEGRLIYKWEQSLDEVMVYFVPPPQVTASQFDIRIERHSLSVGLKGAAPFLRHALMHAVDVDDSTWTLDDGELCITLAKAKAGVTWNAVFPAHMQEEQIEDKKQILRERLQLEHPGFDFRNADITGTVPDASSFLGGFDPKRH